MTRSAFENDPAAQIAGLFAQDELVSASFSLPKRGAGADGNLGSGRPTKVVARPIVARGQKVLQLELRVGTQARHENVTGTEAAARLGELLGMFGQVVVRSASQQTHWTRLTKGPWRSKRSSSEVSPELTVVAHNRAKDYILRDGTPYPFLVAIGVMTGEGKVRAAMYHKFRQINRFLELVRDIVPHLPARDPLTIVDFGCGKSYLTFALHHFLKTELGRTVEITGVDRKETVVADCAALAERLACEGLRFVSGEISGFERETSVDLAISLHACDTATDDALSAAVGWNARVILAVPCCQHEVAPQVAAKELAPLLKHGILKERFAALATDSLRALWLESQGYKTQIVEFIETEHTPKNLLIRATKSTNSARVVAARAEFDAFRSWLGLRELHLNALEEAEHEGGAKRRLGRIVDAE